MNHIIAREARLDELWLTEQLEIPKTDSNGTKCPGSNFQEREIGAELGNIVPVLKQHFLSHVSRELNLILNHKEKAGRVYEKVTVCSYFREFLRMSEDLINHTEKSKLRSTYFFLYETIQLPKLNPSCPSFTKLQIRLFSSDFQFRLLKSLYGTEVQSQTFPSYKWHQISHFGPLWSNSSSHLQSLKITNKKTREWIKYFLYEGKAIVYQKKRLKEFKGSLSLYLNTLKFISSFIGNYLHL